LEELLSDAARNPSILVEYVQGMDRQEPDVVLAVVEALRQKGYPSAVASARLSVIEPLRLMAQDVREEIAAAALTALGTIRLPESATALQTLIPAMSPDLRPEAERLLRKLRFSGVRVDPLPLPDPAWRALVGPPSALGQQSIWFIAGQMGRADVRFLNILLHDRAGAVEAVGHARVLSTMLPPERPLGHLHDVTLPDGSGSLLMLEASFDLGRRLVLEALAENRRTQIPVAGPLRLLSPWLWGVGGVERFHPETCLTWGMVSDWLGRVTNYWSIQPLPDGPCAVRPLSGRRKSSPAILVGNQRCESGSLLASCSQRPR
jgi:hypothetical protein